MQELLDELSNVNDPEVLKEYSRHLVKSIYRLNRELSELKRERDNEMASRQMVIDDELVVLRRIIFGKGSEKRNKGVFTRKRKDNEEDVLLHSQSLVPAPKTTDKKQISSEVRYVPASDDQLAEEARIRGLRNVWDKVKNFCEESKEITVVERQYKEVVIRRQKYRHPDSTEDNQIIITADGPEKLLPGCRYSIVFAVQVIADKYLYHIPLERQRRQMEALGLIVYPKTLSNLVATGAIYLESTAEKILDQILESERIPHLDETPWPINNSKDDDGYMWIVSNAAGSFYRFEPTRSGLIAKETLKKYEGPVMTDGYSGYNRLQELPNITSAYCWSHARRKFIDIEPNYPEPCKEILDQIDGLFEIEREAMSFDELTELRTKRSKPIIDKIKKWLIQKKTEARDQSGFQKAINYSLNHWEGLTRFFSRNTVSEPVIPTTFLPFHLCHFNRRNKHLSVPVFHSLLKQTCEAVLPRRGPFFMR